MSKNKNVVALDLPIPEISDMPEDTQKYFQICQEKLGMIPNVLTAYSQNLKQLEGFTRLYNELMMGESELRVMNYRSAKLDKRQRAMLDFASLLTRTPALVTEEHTQALRDAGLSDRGIWDLSNLVGFYNMSNRVAIASDMQPNPEYHSQSR
jgi:hypothetical protein